LNLRARDVVKVELAAEFLGNNTQTAECAHHRGPLSCATHPVTNWRSEVRAQLDVAQKVARWNSP
jgi:hypothetical protein